MSPIIYSSFGSIPRTKRTRHVYKKRMMTFAKDSEKGFRGQRVGRQMERQEETKANPDSEDGTRRPKRSRRQHTPARGIRQRSRQPAKRPPRAKGACAPRAHPVKSGGEPRCRCLRSAEPRGGSDTAERPPSLRPAADTVKRSANAPSHRARSGLLDWGAVEHACVGLS